jgi:hypothetical protein
MSKNSKVQFLQVFLVVRNIGNVTNVWVHTREHEMASLDLQIEAGQILSFLQVPLL